MYKTIKQHITAEQLDELEYVQRKKLQTLLFHGNPPLGFTEKLNIGKMIEICGDDLFFGHNVIMKVDGEPSPFWSICLCNEDDVYYPETELCDSLWRAVKFILNK